MARIYTEFCFDAGTMETVSNKGFDYNGPMEWCGGGSTTTTSTTTPDYEYNARMASVAEQQQAMSDDLYYNIYKNVYLPYDTAVTNAKMQTIDSATSSEISGNELAQAQNEAALSLLPSQTALTQSQIDAKQNSLNAYQNSGLEAQYLNALQPTGTELAAGRAATSTANALSNSMDALNRSNARMGISPESGTSAAAQRNLAVQGAAAIGGAANNARVTAENENLNKLATAVSYGSGLKG